MSERKAKINMNNIILMGTDQPNFLTNVKKSKISAFLVQ